MSGISLTASMRSNLLSLQNIARQQDIVQNRLATGLKVSSAIDNPSSYYTASSLNNRAADLTALLDAMSQGVQTIKAASEAIDSGTKFLEQAKAVANTARDSAADVFAVVTTESELLAAVNSQKHGIIVIDGNITLSTNQNLVLAQGQSLVGSSYFGGTNHSSLHFDFQDETFSGISAGNGSLISDLAITLSTNSKSFENNGVIQVRENSQNVILRNLDISFEVVDHTDNLSKPFAGIAAPGSSVAIELQGQINIRDNSPLNINDGNNKNSVFIRGIEGGKTGDNAQITLGADTVFNYTSNAMYGHGFTHCDILMKDNAIANISTNGFNSQAFAMCNLTLENSSAVNFDGIFTGYLFEKTNIDIKSAGVVINARTNNPDSLYVTANTLSAAAGATFITANGIFRADTNLSGLFLNQDNGFNPPPGFNQVSAVAPPLPDITAAMDEFKQIDNPQRSENKYAARYEEILSQYDSLIRDAAYKGINLLDRQDLKINFNEDRSSQINIKGVSADRRSLGLSAAEWFGTAAIDQTLLELENAINTLRSFASEFGNYYSIVTTRQDFTENLINVLEEGADKLTLADMNQESANMLALQTSQQLAVNSLSLASQASQSILRLF